MMKSRKSRDIISNKIYSSASSPGVVSSFTSGDSSATFWAAGGEADFVLAFSFALLFLQAAASTGAGVFIESAADAPSETLKALWGRGAEDSFSTAVWKVHLYRNFYVESSVPL